MQVLKQYKDGTGSSISVPLFNYWKEHNRALFRVLGVDPIFGRDFLPEEDRPGGRRVVVLSYDLWRARFGANSALVGQAVSLDGELYPVAEGRSKSNVNRDTGGDSQFRAVSPDYFRAMRIPLLRGRYFTDLDAEGSPGVVIINEAMARKHWPHQDPVGQTIIIAKTMGPEWADRPRQIVGVVGDVKDASLNEPAPPEMFVPYTQLAPHFVALMVRVIPTRWVLRTQGDPHSLTRAAAQAVLAVDANEPIASVKTMEEVLSGSISRWRFNMFLLGVFSALALVLAAVGIYGVLSYSVAQRTHELGIRMALGAERKDVLRLVVGRGLKLVVIGVAIGILGAIALTRFLSSLLYGVKPTDPLTFIAVSLISRFSEFLSRFCNTHLRRLAAGVCLNY